MRKILLSAIGCAALMVGGRAAGDPIDNFALALKNIVQPARVSQSLSLVDDEDRDDRGQRDRTDPFYKLTLEARLEDLDARWKKKDRLSDTEMQLLEQQTRETLLLTVSTMTGDGLKTIRELVQSISKLDIARVPIEKLADLVFLAGRLFEQVTQKAYKENITKLYLVAKCIGISANKRADPADKAGQTCQKQGCVSAVKCVGVMADYTEKFLRPVVEALVEGVEADGRHIKGVLDNVIGLALIAEESPEAKRLKSYGKIAVLGVKMAVKLREASVQKARG